jgi:MYXO-CTERM domain-containing protein
LNPDVVLFWFGGNDSFQQNWAAHKGEFHADYLRLVRTFQELPSHPKTLLVRLWVFVDGPVQRTVVDKEILPIIDQIAVETGSVAIDYRKAFEMHPEYFPDGMHPNDTGTLAIGKLFADAVMGALAAQDAGTDGAPPDVARPSGDAAAADVTVVDADGASITADAGQGSVTAGSGGSTSVAGAGGSTAGSGGAAAGGSGGASVGTSGGSATGGSGTVGNADGGRSTTSGEAPGMDATSGCSCRVASRTREPRASLLFVVLAAALGFGRRRRRVAAGARELRGGCGSA